MQWLSRSFVYSNITEQFSRPDVVAEPALLILTSVNMSYITSSMLQYNLKENWVFRKNERIFRDPIGIFL